MSLKNIFKLLCPPILRKALNFIRNDRVRFSGNYYTWADAQKHSTGYDSELILKKVQESSRKVIQGDAVYERDSVCFYEENYRWPLLSCLFMLANKHDSQLHVIDFGGSLGSLYFQHKRPLSTLKKLTWSVVEQSHFVEAGKHEFENETLTFHLTLTEASKHSRESTVVVLSSVLPYLENPQTLLKKIKDIGINYILIDRTPFIFAEKNRLTVQSVPATIYPASYPAWFFSSAQFDNLMQTLDYKCIYSFDCEDDVGVGKCKGFLYEKF